MQIYVSGFLIRISRMYAVKHVLTTCLAEQPGKYSTRPVTKVDIFTLRCIGAVIDATLEQQFHDSETAAM